MTHILETKRLILRHQVIADLDDLWALYCNPNITKYIPDAPRSRAEAQEELEWHMHGHPKHPELGLWATIHTETGKFNARRLTFCRTIKSTSKTIHKFPRT